jgi:hypothetical protein
MSFEIEAAQVVLQTLERKLGAAHARLADSEALASAIAYRSHADGDADARKRLVAAETDAMKCTLEIKSLTAAIAEAKFRVQEAVTASNAEAERERAKQARVVLQRLAKRGEAIDAGFAQAREHYHGLQSDLSELARLGAPTPSAELTCVNLLRASDAALSGLHDKIRPVAPLQRHNFAELGAGWAKPSEQWAAKVLEAPEHKAARAA